MSETSKAPDLEQRFLEPKGWRWDHFKNDGRTIRFGTMSPQDNIPDAVVVCLPGLSEFAEKYFEVAQSLVDRNMSVWVLDWMGQGRSDRYLDDNPHKRHSHGFDQDIDDLHKFILNHIKPSSVHADKEQIPLAMLAHSMGGHIGLRYLARYPDIFECAALSTPMIGLKDLRSIPPSLAKIVTAAFNFLSGEDYVHGGGDWRQDMRPSPGHDAFSSDPVRGAVHNAWCLADPKLQVGRITYGWLHEAVKSCAQLQKTSTLENIHTRCLITLAGHEDFIDNPAIRRAAKIMPQAELLEFPKAAHETLMECDDIRDVFLEDFQKLIKEKIIAPPSGLETFLRKGQNANLIIH